MSPQTYRLPEKTHWMLSNEYNFAQVTQGIWMEKMSFATELLATGQSAGSAIARFHFLLGAGGLAITVVNTFIGLGLPYAEAAQDAHNRNMKWGFSIGFVSGIFEKDWGFVKSSFIDQSLPMGLVAREGKRGLHGGLVAGFVAARKLPIRNRKALCESLALELDTLAKQQVESCSWFSFVLHFARAFQKNHVSH
jgi:hypothetical protein